MNAETRTLNVEQRHYELNIITDIRKAICLIYRLKYPDDEKYGLQNQIRRAVISILLNLTEGNSYFDTNKYRFFDMARGSCSETIECINISRILDFISKDNELDDIMNKIQRTVVKLCQNRNQK
jgi:four helix bundle protein